MRILVVLFALIPSVAHATEWVDYDVKFSPLDIPMRSPKSHTESLLPRGEYSVLLWGRSRHLKTPRQFNEENWGSSFQWKPEGLDLRFSLGHIENSLDGRTWVLGMSTEAKVLQLNGIGLRLGFELNYLQYGVPGACRGLLCREPFTKEGVLPMVYLSIGDDRHRLVVHQLVQYVFLWGFWLRI